MSTSPSQSRTTLQFSLCLLILGFCASAQTQPTAPPRVRGLEQPSLSQSTLTVVPELYWQMERTAAARLAALNLQVKISHQGEGTIVINQDPLPDTRVAKGTVVNLTIGPPQLLLTLSSPTVKTNQEVTFTATLEPPLPKTALEARTFLPPRAKYTFDWDDSTQTGPTDATSVSHRYTIARTYNVSARVQIGNSSLTSNTLTVTAENPVQAPTNQVTLRVAPRSVEIGNQIVATVTVMPSPGADTSYIFVWGDGSRETRPSPTATHSYGPPASRHAIQAIVNINSVQIHSNPIVVQVTVPAAAAIPPPQPQTRATRWSAWQIVIAIAMAVAGIIGGYSLFRSRLRRQPRQVPESLSFTAGHRGVDHEIQYPERITSKLRVHIKSGCISQTSIKSAQSIAKERSASNAGNQS